MTQNTTIQAVKNSANFSNNNTDLETANLLTKRSLCANHNYQWSKFRMEAGI